MRIEEEKRWFAVLCGVGFSVVIIGFPLLIHILKTDSQERADQHRKEQENLAESIRLQEEERQARLKAYREDPPPKNPEQERRENLISLAKVNPQSILSMAEEDRRYIVYGYGKYLCTDISGEGYYVRKRKKEAFLELKRIAEKAGVSRFYIKAASYDSYNSGGRRRETVGGQQYVTETFRSEYLDWINAR